MYDVTRNYVILDGSPIGRLRFISRRLIAVSIYLLLPCAMGIAARFDGAWKLPGNDKGFSQHFGYWVLFLTTPIVLLITAHLLETFTATIKSLDVLYVRTSAELQRKTEQLITRHLDHLSLRTTPAISLAGFVALVMLFFCIINVINTSREPLHKSVECCGKGDLSRYLGSWQNSRRLQGWRGRTKGRRRGASSS